MRQIILMQETGNDGQRAKIVASPYTPDKLFTVECVFLNKTLFRKTYGEKQMHTAFFDYRGCISGKKLKDNKTE